MKLTKEGIAVVEGDTYLSADIEAQGRLDVAREFLEQFRPYIPVGGVVVDVGACLGDYTATFAEMVGPKGRVIAIEPNPVAFHCLKYNMREYSNVDSHVLALGAQAGLATVTLDENNIGASRMSLDSSGTINVATLDRVYQVYRFGRLDFLKIDAEGWEPLILDGAKATVSRFRPVILLEVNHWMLGKLGLHAEDIYSRLEALNYRFPRVEGLHDGDILCLPKERA